MTKESCWRALFALGSSELEGVKVMEPEGASTSSSRPRILQLSSRLPCPAPPFPTALVSRAGTGATAAESAPAEPFMAANLRLLRPVEELLGCRSSRGIEEGGGDEAEEVDDVALGAMAAAMSFGENLRAHEAGPGFKLSPPPRT